MTAPTRLSPYPSVGFSLTLVDAVTNTEVTLPPYGNTKEVIILNTDATNGVWFRWAEILVVQAQVNMVLVTGTADIGDLITFAPAWHGGAGLVGAPARVPGANNFDATLTGIALRDDIITALNDGGQAWAGLLTAAAGPTTNGLFSVTITVAAAALVGAASNHQFITSDTGTTPANYNFYPHDSTSSTVGYTAGGRGTALASLTIDGTTSTFLPANTGITLAIEQEGDRNDLMGTYSDPLWGSASSSGIGLVFRADAGGPFDVNITYVQGPGGGGAS